MPKISQLPAATSVGSSDLYAIVQGSTTKKATQSLVVANIESTIQITESQVTGLTADLASKLAKASNLSDVASVSTSRQNLGLGPLDNGELIIGSTGNNPALTTLTAGSGITITNGAGSITIASSGGGPFSWTEVTGTSQQAITNAGYITNNGALVTITLPTTAAIGDELIVVGKGAGGWTIAQNALQFIQIGSSASTIGTGGSVSSTNRYDSLYLVCTTANTAWTTVGGPQSAGLTIV